MGSKKSVGEIKGRRNRIQERMITRLGFDSGLKIEKQNTGKCDHCEENETIQHVLLDCKIYTIERNYIW